MKSFNVGIIGAGHIAPAIVHALSPLDGYDVVAVASRSMDRAVDFASRYGIGKAYGSYEALADDPDVDLVYVATPHSLHYAHARMVIGRNKPVLVEKAFTVSAREAEELADLAYGRGVFMAEAMWTRYMPLSHKISALIAEGAIGTPRMLSATLGYKIDHKERIIRGDLGGGALLDLGVYVINFARMCFGDNIESMESLCVAGQSGVDLQETITLRYRDGRMASLQATALAQTDRQGVVSGTDGFIRVDNVNCPRRVDVVRDNEVMAEYVAPADMVNGYEYQIMECRRCIEAGLLQTPMMPHGETIAVMRMVDALHERWGMNGVFGK